MFQIPQFLQTLIVIDCLGGQFSLNGIVLVGIRDRRSNLIGGFCGDGGIRAADGGFLGTGKQSS